MKAIFFPALSGQEIQGGILGDLRPVADTAAGPSVITGESLASIRAEHAIAPSPAARISAAKASARVASIPVLTARQLRLWLISAGLSPEAVDAQIAAIPDATTRAKARVEWEYAIDYHRSHPLVAQLGAALGLTPEQIDAAFTAAAKL